MDIRQEEDIRIGTWNIRKQATLGLESEELQAKIEIVMDYMRSMDIQIMALQETGRGQEKARAIEKAVNSREYKAYANPNKGGLAIIIHKNNRCTQIKSTNRPKRRIYGTTPTTNIGRRIQK